MKVAFICKNYKNIYSGGRIYALTLAKAFSNFSEVDFFTNIKPIFFDEIISKNDNERFNIKINKLFIFKIEKKYDLIVLAPHLNSLKSSFFDRLFFYRFAKHIKRVCKSRFWFIDFESPNWVNSVFPGLRSDFEYKNSNQIIKIADLVLSISNTGMKFSKEYYSKINKKLNFKFLYPPINSFEAKKVKNKNKENKIVFFARFNQIHKDPNNVIKIIKSMPCDFSLEVIYNKNRVDKNLLTKILNQASINNVTINFHDRISDFEKYQLLANSKLLIFTSKFEGYGLPPVESQFMNTPVICSDLQVLREINKFAVFDDFESVERLRKKIKNIILDTDKLELRSKVSSFATFENFVVNLKNTL